ncbi:histidine decarboxylase, pyruvoyl type (plasmid) [Rhizobium ruizarguesonis]|uniref:Histidine decarboxylase, pyruvoyl type n=1 Tax=Rhizobium ruizarguesonis TaxID=2081791 RepID=A0ACD5EGV8_9HYPH
MFNEDGGMFGDAQTKEADVRSFLQQTLDCVGNSIVACGQNHNVRYGRISAGAKALYVPEGYYGCAIACGPYLTLAQRTIPLDGQRRVLPRQTGRNGRQRLDLFRWLARRRFICHQERSFLGE